MNLDRLFTPLAIILAMALLAVLPGWGAIPARADAPPDVHFPLVYFEAYDCLQKPILLAPSDSATLDTLVPLFQWDAGHPFYARLVQLDVARDPDFARLAASMSTSAVEGEGSFRFPSNFEPHTIGGRGSCVAMASKALGPRPGPSPPARRGKSFPHRCNNRQPMAAWSIVRAWSWFGIQFLAQCFISCDGER